jgi:hypothetical protein
MMGGKFLGIVGLTILSFTFAKIYQHNRITRHTYVRQRLQKTYDHLAHTLRATQEELAALQESGHLRSRLRKQEFRPIEPKRVLTSPAYELDPGSGSMTTTEQVQGNRS